MNIIKIEARASLLHTATFLYKSEALSESIALKTLSIILYIIEDLPIDRLLQEGRGEGSNAGFDIFAEMIRAVRMGSPGSDSHSNKTEHREFYLKTYLGSDNELNITDGSGNSSIRLGQERRTQITTADSRQDPIAECTFAECTSANVPPPRHSGSKCPLLRRLFAWASRWIESSLFAPPARLCAYHFMMVSKHCVRRS
jgi:hypothetical protein